MKWELKKTAYNIDDKREEGFTLEAKSFHKDIF